MNFEQPTLIARSTS